MAFKRQLPKGYQGQREIANEKTPIWEVLVKGSSDKIFFLNSVILAKTLCNSDDPI